MAPDSVFISFRSDDRATARKIAARFEAEGIDVWFDETDLDPGDRYKAKIASHIFNCFAFVPLISRHSISCDSQPWFYRFEWNRAIEAAEFRPKAFPFLSPLILESGTIKPIFDSFEIGSIGNERLTAQDLRCGTTRREWRYGAIWRRVGGRAAPAAWMAGRAPPQTRLRKRNRWP
jgi:hypothetical protein